MFAMLIRIVKSVPVLRIAVTGMVLPALFLTGCLTRSANGPSLPYVKPATDVGSQADPVKVQIASRMQEMETELQRLWDTIERLKAAGGDEKEINALRERITFIESKLGIDPLARVPARPSQHAGAAWPQQPTASPGRAANAPGYSRTPATTANPGPPANPRAAGTTRQAQPVEIVNPPLKTDEEEYRTAYTTYTRGDLDTAVQLFETFLKSHPKSNLAADATYWIGEAHFSKGRYDEAILQFDRVIKEYPGSKKELSALLKQGQSFENSGDALSARYIFEKLVKDHPHTSQARKAALRLKSLPKDSANQTTHVSS
jgi:tol-pal system protein YbgF